MDRTFLTIFAVLAVDLGIYMAVLTYKKIFGENRRGRR